MNPERTTLLVGVALVVVALLAVIVVAAVPSSTGARLDAILADVESLREAELDHIDAFGHPVAAAAAPRVPSALDEAPVPWAPSEGFRTLAWAPADRDEVPASYAVVVDGDDFVITARCDLDGDGVLAEIQASREAPAARRSPPAVR